MPFGEYLPFQKFLESLGLMQLTKVPGGFIPGDRRRAMDVPRAPRMLPLICYEIIFPGEAVPGGERPGWLLNLTNDGWFGISTGPYQHFQQARVRAIEQGLPLVRAANTGISAVIDPARPHRPVAAARHRRRARRAAAAADRSAALRAHRRCRGFPDDCNCRDCPHSPAHARAADCADCRTCGSCACAHASAMMIDQRWSVCGYGSCVAKALRKRTKIVMFSIETISRCNFQTSLSQRASPTCASYFTDCARDLNCEQ